MRMRRKPWARPELSACAFFVPDPPALRGNWHAAFAKQQPMHVELGCGKGNFICDLACAHPEINYIAIDIKSEVLAVTKRNIEQRYHAADRDIDNILLMSFDIARIHLLFSSADIVDKIYIHFPNPWPKERHKKHRLTHPRQLQQYRDFLADNGHIFFKTDDMDLFRDSIDYFAAANFAIVRQTDDLPLETGAPISEHEMTFRAKALPIYAIDAVKQPEIRTTI